ncbi:MAG: hypothetical protein AB1816_09920 [Bacillota bacterium]|jgi:hypothetical protein
MGVSEDILRAVERLDRADQLNLAHWIIHREEGQFDLTESFADLEAIRKGLGDVRERRIMSGRRVAALLSKR